MKKNLAGQMVGCQLIGKTDGSAITAGTTTVYVTGDGGTQAAGSVGSGACTHKGNGYWTYAPAQAETNYEHVAFTFVNSNAVNATVQIYPSFPQSGDSFARVGAPAGANVSADIATIAAYVDTEVGAIKTKTDQLTFTTANKVDATMNAASDLPQACADKVWSTTTRALTDKAGFALSAAAIQAIWDALASALSAVGSIGKLLVDNLNATVSSRATPAQVNSECASAINDAGLATAADLTLVIGFVDTEIAAIKSKTDQLTFSTANQVDAKAVTNSDKTGYVLSAVGSAALTETYAADGASATLPQILYLILALLGEKSITGMTLTAKKLDGVTPAATFTLDNDITPTSITRTT